MSLEDAINRLSSVVQSAISEQQASVREIIRQRDEAEKMVRGQKNRIDFLEGQVNTKKNIIVSQDNKIRALRGANTRLRNQRKELR